MRALFLAESFLESVAPLWMMRASSALRHAVCPNHRVVRAHILFRFVKSQMRIVSVEEYVGFRHQWRRPLRPGGAAHDGFNERIQVRPVPCSVPLLRAVEVAQQEFIGGAPSRRLQ